MITYLFLRFGIVLTRYIPVRLGYLLATVFARIAYLRGGTRRRALFQNLTHVMGGSATRQEVVEIARRGYRNLAKYYYEFLRLPHIGNPELSRLVRFDGLEYLNRLIRAKRGAILVSPHMGNWDVVGAVLSARYGRIYSVAESLRPRQLHDLFVETRAAVGIEIIPEGGAARKILHVLRRGGIVVLICDRDLAANGVQVSFFGATTTMPRGPVALALRTGAPVVPVFCMRQHDNTLMVHVWAPIKLQVTGDRGRDIAINTQKIADCFESAIKRDPSQWFVMQSVWHGDES